MFPFENSGEISFQSTNNNEQEQDLEDLILHNELLASINLSNPSTTTTSPTTTTTTKGRGRGSGRGHGRKSWPADTRDGAGVISSSGGLGIINEENDMKKKKKMVHREIERQRRQEMSSLFSNLHSLLPLQYVKGKRSTSDHITESINYIKDLHKNIKDLGDKRDELKLFKDYKSGDTLGHGDGSSTRSTTGCNIAVYTSAVGLQVQIFTGQSDERFALSTALKVLHEDGLNVISCASNRANKAFFHHILCQVNDTKCFNMDIERLQQRLYGAVC